MTQDLSGDFAFEFTLTVRDRLDAERAERAAAFGPRTRWLVGFSVAALAVLGWWTVPGGSLNAFWVLLAVGLAWEWVMRPAWRRASIRVRTHPSRVSAHFAANGLTVHTEGAGQADRLWEEVDRLSDTAAGLLLHFDDGRTFWLPRRVFSDAGQREAFADFARAHATRARLEGDSSIWRRHLRVK